ncbi:MAG: 4Fe-4S binding protein [Candidatus Bipolaricaulota bacterium]|nr:MAG: 4Fe-4S binding protein [Candidatus Bipolaricaulota bacterium]
MREVEEQLRSEVVRLFAEGAIDLFLGYSSSRVPLRSAACVLHDADGVARLVWNRTCTPNLAALLRELLRSPPGATGDAPPRIGLLAKGCVSRSLVTLMKANQISRESLLIIGVDCPGMIDRHKVAARVGGEIAAAIWSGDDLAVRATGSGEHILSAEDVLLDDCRTCAHPSAVLSDRFLGEPRAPRRDALDDPASSLTEAEPEERWSHFQGEVARCIRCYACREACPNCFCTECFADASDPRWIGVTTDETDLALFHLGRAFHQAGRCVSCGACVSACPLGIDLRMLYEKVNGDVKVRFGTDVGTSLDEPEPLCRFALEDDETFMTEPGKGGRGMGVR